MESALLTVPLADDFDRLRMLNDSLITKVSELCDDAGVDVREHLREVECAAAANSVLMEALHSCAPIGLAYLDRDFRFLRVNRALAEMNRLDVEDHLGYPVSELLPEVWSQLEVVFRSVLHTGEPVVNYEVVGDGEALPRGRWLDSVYPVRIGDEIVGVGVVIVDISARLRAEEFRAAITETMLEGLYALDVKGRLTFMNAAASEMLGWSEAELLGRDVHAAIHNQRADGTPLLERECPLWDVRHGGPALRAVDDTFTRRDGTMFPVNYSAAPLANAEAGQGVVVVFRDATRERSEQLTAQRELAGLQWLGRTRDALDENRLVLYSQPVVPLAGGQACEELLLRMIGRDGEVVAPGNFLPVAERYGLVCEIDRWVIAQAVRIAAGGRRVTVNLSAKSMELPLLGYIADELRQAGAEAANVIFELTETALMEDVGAGEKFAQGLTDIGCGLALDDFGTGFASLAYLQILPVEYLKIDISFVTDLTTNETNQHLVKAVVSLARGLGQKTIAEGVEDADTMELLREYGVDFAQGYHLGRPAPIEMPAVPR